MVNTMLLRSSSTPVLGSLIASVLDSPNNNHHHQDSNAIFKHQSRYQLSYHQTGCLNLTSASCSSSPISPSIAEFSDHYSSKGIRRAQSEGNMDGLAYASCSSHEEFYTSSQPKKIPGRSKCLMLETIPSFSLCNSRSRQEDDEEEDEENEMEEGEEENETTEGDLFSLTNKMKNMAFTEEVRVLDRTWNGGLSYDKRGFVDEEMYLARGLGIGGGAANDINGGNSGGGNGGGGGGGDNFGSAGGEGGEMHGTEEYYRKMLQQNPGNPLFLRNYAKFLSKGKEDLHGAEEFFSRAILADPNDGEILSEYAKLVWQLHHDQDRASSYFERAVKAAPEDSHVHAAYASFLWETEEDEDECSVPKDINVMPSHFHEGTLASAGG